MLGLERRKVATRLGVFCARVLGTQVSGHLSQLELTQVQPVLLSHLSDFSWVQSEDGPLAIAEVKAFGERIVCHILICGK